jgi:hypothetical protein
MTLLSLCAAAPLSAADDADKVTLTGFADTTYNYNLNSPKSETNTYHSYDSTANSFVLNNAQIEASGALDKGTLTYVFKLNYGTDATATQSAMGATPPPAAQRLEVTEAYGQWIDPGSHLGVKVGKFATYEGIEVIESMNNPTITRGFLFGLAEPFTLTGALALYIPNDKLEVGLGLVNGWDLNTDDNHSKTIMGEAKYNWGDPFALVASFLYGPEKPANNKDERFSLDLTGVTKPTKQLTVNLQVNYGSEQKASLKNPNDAGKWWGFSIQPVYTVTDKFSVGGRLELFNDKDGARAGVIDQQLFTVSIAPAYQVTKHFLARAEFRVDSSNKDVFENSDGVVNKKQQSEVAAEAIFSF